MPIHGYAVPVILRTIVRQFGFRTSHISHKLTCFPFHRSISQKRQLNRGRFASGSSRVQRRGQRSRDKSPKPQKQGVHNLESVACPPKLNEGGRAETALAARVQIEG